MSEVKMLSFSLEATKLAVIGLGYVGLPLAVEFGKHRPVVGFDINTNRISALKAGVVSDQFELVSTGPVALTFMSRRESATRQERRRGSA
jgi:UDP-N-acetyl-D-mannosaminuronate dehydrogenase